MADAQALFKDHAGNIFGYLCRYTLNHVEAEDLLSDVFVRLLEQFDRMKDREFDWKPWLYRVATNLAISNFRKKKVRQFFLRRQPKGAESAGFPDDPVEMSEEGARIKDAVEKLGRRHKAVILMRVYQNFSYEEISAALGINVGTVKSRLNEAKKKIKAILEGKDE